ncbi:MAG: glycosyltransferase [Betaproteobacteria bacterium]|nr:glycosyltransferase [Betaproteobacteria bacterium]
MSGAGKLLSVVVPVFRNEANLPETVPRLLALKDQIGDHGLELVFVDDGSDDGSYRILEDFAAAYPRVIRVIKLSRNFGQTPAIQAGLRVASGEVIGIISADLQEPPEAFAAMIRLWEKGAKFVIGERQSRAEGRMHQKLSGIYWNLVRRYAFPDFPRLGYDFCVHFRSDLLAGVPAGAPADQPPESRARHFAVATGLEVPFYDRHAVRVYLRSGAVHHVCGHDRRGVLPRLFCLSPRQLVPVPRGAARVDDRGRAVDAPWRAAALFPGHHQRVPDAHPRRSAQAPALRDRKSDLRRQVRAHLARMRPEAYSAAAQAEENHWWFAARREVLAAVLERLYVRAANPSVLEVGCGNGGNLAMLARYGALYATEIEDQARARATSRGIAVVENGWLPDGLPFAGALFDLVAALDVLEHVADDAAALAALGQRLKPDGLLFLTVPAYPWLWSPHDEFSQHKRRYTLGGMRSLVERCGLRVTYASYFNCLLFPFGAVAVRFRHGAISVAESVAAVLDVHRRLRTTNQVRGCPV